MPGSVPQKPIARSTSVKSVVPTGSRATSVHDDQAEACLKKAAEIVKLSLDKEVVFPPQSDSATMWKAVAVHPLQPLENAHQRIVREAARKEEERQVASGQRDDAELRNVVSEAMSNFFVFDSGTP